MKNQIGLTDPFIAPNNGSMSLQNGYTWIGNANNIATPQPVTSGGTVTSLGVSSPNQTLSLTGTNPVTSSGTVGVDLATTGVSAKTYALPSNASVDAYGRITSMTDLGLVSGTFTPVITFGGVGINGFSKYSQQTGQYMKIGNIVFYSFSISGSTRTSASGQARIEGFPFPVSGSNATVLPYNSFPTDGYTFLDMQQGTKTAFLWSNIFGDGKPALLATNTNFDSAVPTTILWLSSFYFTSS